MTIYIAVLVSATLIAYLGEHNRCSKLYNGEAEEKMVPAPGAAAILLAMFCCMYALRWRVGTDFSGYYHSFFKYGQTSIKELLNTRDWGFEILSALLFRLLPNNFVIYNFILSIITYAPVIYVYRRFSDDFSFTIFLYIAMLICFWPYNGVRQSLAGSICFGGFPLLKDRKYLKYIVVVLVAASFHSTALIMLPLMFFVNLKPWDSKMIIITVIILASIFLLENIWSGIIDFLDVIGQDKMVSDYGDVEISSNSVNALRIIVLLIPVAFSFVMHKKCREVETKEVMALENMAVLSALFMIAASRLTVLARFSSYFDFSLPLLYVKFLHLFTKNSRLLFIAVVMICYFVYMLVLLPVDSNLIPYRFIFNAS